MKRNLSTGGTSERSIDHGRFGVGTSKSWVKGVIFAVAVDGDIRRLEQRMVACKESIFSAVA